LNQRTDLFRRLIAAKHNKPKAKSVSDEGSGTFIVEGELIGGAGGNGSITGIGSTTGAGGAGLTTGIGGAGSTGG